MLLRYQWLNQIKIHELGYVVGHILRFDFLSNTYVNGRVGSVQA